VLVSDVRKRLGGGLSNINKIRILLIFLRNHPEAFKEFFCNSIEAKDDDVYYYVSEETLRGVFNDPG